MRVKFWELFTVLFSVSVYKKWTFWSFFRVTMSYGGKKARRDSSLKVAHLWMRLRGAVQLPKILQVQSLLFAFLFSNCRQLISVGYVPLIKDVTLVSLHGHSNRSQA